MADSFVFIGDRLLMCTDQPALILDVTFSGVLDSGFQLGAGRTGYPPEVIWRFGQQVSAPHKLHEAFFRGCLAFLTACVFSSMVSS